MAGRRFSLRIFMFSWEYPPRIIGGLARHVEGLAQALASLGNEVHVITLDFPGAPPEEEKGSLFIHRVTVEVSAPTFHTWVLMFNHFFEKKAGQLARKYGDPTVIHIHDWLTVSSGVAVKHLLGVPLVMTFHSTESSRSSSSRSPESTMVEGLEWWGSYEAARVIAVSAWMKSEVVSQFRTPAGKVADIPNAVDTIRFEKEVNRESIRAKWGVHDRETLVTAAGRLTSQKGFDDLIRAYSSIREVVPDSRLLIIGEGYMRGELEGLATSQRVRDRTTFAGFVSDSELVDAMKSSDVVVVPSKFEPFGIVALEAMAAGVPVIVSRVGGLAEIVDDLVDGVEVNPNDPRAISDAVVRLLTDRELASRLSAKGKEKAKVYSWEESARRTLEAYNAAVGGTKYD